MNRAMTTSQRETLKTCWTLWTANGRRPFKFGEENAARVRSLVSRKYLTKDFRGRTLSYTFTSLGEDMARLHAKHPEPKELKAAQTFARSRKVARVIAAHLNPSTPVSGELEALRADVRSRDERIEELEAQLSDRAVPATDGKPSGPEEGDSASSPPSAGPLGAVALTVGMTFGAIH